MTEQREFMQGATVAGYRVESLIGRGGMSVVYLAEDVHLGRKVALKLLAPDLAQDEKFRERFVRESRLAASLEHPNIVTVYDARESDGLLYIAMRYVAGGDLKTLIAQEGPLDPERTVSILGQAASALDTAHAEGLIHRDVKPGNMLITPRSESFGIDRVYLSDFGLTKRASSDSGITATGQFVGTLDYAAPEQFEGKALDGRADVYSLGCVLYECLTGEVPYPRDNQAALVYAHLMAAPPKVTDRRPALPSAVDAVVARAMSKSKEDRYPTAGELVAAAADALGVQAVAPTTPTSPTTPTRPVPPTAPPPRRRRPQASLLAGWGAVAAIVVLVVVLLTRGGGHPASAGPPTAAGAGLTDYVARIDPVAGRVLGKIRVGKDPAAVTTAEGSAWVANSGDDTVSRIDPVSGKVSATIKVGKDPIALVAGDSGVWVDTLLENSISRIDPDSNRVVARFHLDERPQALAIGDGAIWVADSRSTSVNSVETVLDQIDPTSGTLVRKVLLPGEFIGPGPGTWAMAAGGGSLWAGGQQGVLYRIDSATGKVMLHRSLEKWIGSISLAAGKVWVGTNGIPGTIYGFDALSGDVTDRFAAGAGKVGAPGSPFSIPIRLAADDQNVWVADVVNGTINRVVILSGQSALPVQIGTVPTGVAIGLGSVWVTVDGR
jgi:YVTN family beta-propeller protein